MKFFENDSLEILFKKNLSYSEFLEKQKELTSKVQNKSKKNYIIVCNHSPLLTIGRGDRQNNSKGVSYGGSLPCYKIKRGGGLTFHGKNQLILYPIIKLDNKFGFRQYLDFLMSFSVDLLERFSSIRLKSKQNPLGLWYNHLKVGSLGISLERLVTNHGIAVNVNQIEVPLQELNPCGLHYDQYTSLMDVVGTSFSMELLFEQTIEKLLHTNIKEHRI